MNQRLLLDDISNLRAAIQHSLSAGILPRCSITVYNITGGQRPFSVHFWKVAG